MERGLTENFRDYVEFLHESFNSQQVELIVEAKMEYDSGCLGFEDSFEDAMWYKMNRSGLFDEEGWSINDSRYYVSDNSFNLINEIEARKTFTLMKSSSLWIGNK